MKQQVFTSATSMSPRKSGAYVVPIRRAAARRICHTNKTKERYILGGAVEYMQTQTKNTVNRPRGVRQEGKVRMMTSGGRNTTKTNDLG